MGASIFVCWPGASEDEKGGHPGFWNDDQGYAHWICGILESPWRRLGFRLRGLGPLLHVYSADNPAERIDWTTPTKLKNAARRLHGELASGSAFAASVARLYDRGPGEDPPEAELARDLSDVAKIAEYAEGRGARQVALTIGW